MFKPINEAHAIAEAVVFFEFNPDLSSVLPLPGLKVKLAKEFPLAEEPSEVRLEVAPDGAFSMRQFPSGLKLTRFRSNGNPEWQINIGAPAISFHCLDYSRWTAVWAEMRSYMAVVFHEMGAASTSIASVGLRYIDRFLWTSTPDKFESSQLFNTQSKWLHSAAFSSGARWHCHTGWFDNDKDLGEILNQLNIDSGNAIVDGATTVLVTVDHTQTLRRHSESALDRYGKILTTGSSALDDLMKQLHGGNKNVLQDLLTPNMRKLIKLDGGTQ